MNDEQLFAVNLLEEARQVRRFKGPICAVQRLRLSDPTLYGALMEALASDVELSALSEVLLRKGVEMDRNMLGRHRHGLCVRCRS